MRIFLRVEFPESKRVEVKFKSIKERSRALAVVVAGDRSQAHSLDSSGERAAGI